MSTSTTTDHHQQQLPTSPWVLDLNRTGEWIGMYQAIRAGDFQRPLQGVFAKDPVRVRHLAPSGYWTVLEGLGGTVDLSQAEEYAEILQDLQAS